jgi:hypothetical protein
MDLGEGVALAVEGARNAGAGVHGALRAQQNMALRCGDPALAAA